MVYGVVPPVMDFIRIGGYFFFLKKRNLKKEIVIQALHVCFHSSFSYFFFLVSQIVYS